MFECKKKYLQDCSSAPLFTSVDPSVMEMPIYVKLAALYDNYVTSPVTVEDHTEEEQMEKMALIEVSLDINISIVDITIQRKWPAQML
jgi:hypothetical protein